MHFYSAVITFTVRKMLLVSVGSSTASPQTHWCQTHQEIKTQREPTSTAEQQPEALHIY